jgi:two-component system heavy metal sensor histidine kinase CusS
MNSRRRKRPLSLTTRVTIFVAVAVGLSFLGIGYLVNSAIEHHFAEQDADELVVIKKVVDRALSKAGDNPVDLAEVLSHAVSGHHGVYFQIWDREKNLIYGLEEDDSEKAINTFAPMSSIQAGSLYDWQKDGKTYRGTITQTNIGGHEYFIVTAINMDAHIRFINNFRQSLWFIMILAGTLTLLAAWYGVHQGHSPLRELSETIREIQADRLQVRLDPETMPRELRNLVSSFNFMIGRLEDSFTRLSHFSADIAHELRTPLTNIITQSQVILSRSRSLDEYRELHYSNLEELERLTKMVNDMLWLAKSENGLLKTIREPLDMNKEVHELFEFFEALAEEKQIRLELEGQAPRIMGDRAMLRRALSNLLSNALRHSPSGESVKVRLGRSDDDQVLLSIQNIGPEIPDEHQHRIFDRFYRVDPSRQRQSEGAGLGLAIVKSIIEAHGWSIRVESRQCITEFTINVPSPLITLGEKAI